MPQELVFFHKGLSFESRSAMQQPGVLKSAINISFEKEGEQGTRVPLKAVNTTAVNAIHSVRRFNDILIEADTTNLRFRSALTDGDFTVLSAAVTSAAWNWTEYKNFLYGCNGVEEVLIDKSGNCYPARIENPATACAGATPDAGDLTGSYYLYCSYFIVWPNGQTYETGLSPVSADVTPSSDKINWSSIPTLTYTAYYGASSTIGTNTKLYISGYGVDDSTSITDTKGKTVTLVGGSHIEKISDSIWGSAVYFDGTGDYLTVADSADWVMGTTAFTVDFYVRFKTVPSGNVFFFAQYASGTDYAWCFYNKSTDLIDFTLMTASTSQSSRSAFVPVANTWYHVAIVRGWASSNTTVAVAIDGTDPGAQTGFTNDWTNMAAVLEIGAGATGGNFDGWITGFRVTKGEALWTANFTPPTVPPGPLIYRKLYRGPGLTGTLGDIYYVATIADNVTTTYVDNVTDATLAAAGACYTTDYMPGPAKQSYACFHYGRCFWVDAEYKHRLTFSETVSGLTSEENESLMPLASLDDNWDDIRAAGVKQVDPQGIVSWGINLYIPLKDTWIRKQGNDPDTWAYRKTYAAYGVAAPATIAMSAQPTGIIFLTQPDGGNPGLALFNGQTAELFTSPRFDYIFQTDMNQAYISTCVGACVGRYYLFAYPSGSGTVPDTLLAFDLRRFPDIRVSEWKDTAVKSIDNYEFGKNFYIGGSDGYVRKNDTTYAETINVEVETHELIGGDPQYANHEKYLKELKYALNAGAGSVVMTLYIDGTAATWADGSTSKTLTGTGETVQVMKDFPQNFRGYRFRIKLVGTAMATFTLYSPWQLDFDVKP
jgi:hypothetical protein